MHKHFTRIFVWAIALIISVSSPLYIGVKVADALIGDVSFTQLPVPATGPYPNYYPYSITNGPDGALWLTTPGNQAIWQIKTNGSATEYKLPEPLNDNSNIPPDGMPQGITSGPDGALWFVDYYGNKVGRITTDGSISEYTVPNTNANMVAITSGPDGALWFLEQGSNQVGRITTSGVVTEFTLPPLPDGNTTTYFGLSDIIKGPDGALWITSYNIPYITRIATDGSVSYFRVQTPYGGSSKITVGGDGALWFTTPFADLGRMTTSGEYSTHPTAAGPTEYGGLTTGPDGSIWYFSNQQNVIGHLSLNGDDTLYPSHIVGNYTTVPNMVIGSDGALWFTSYGTGQVGRLDLTPPDTTPPVVTGAQTPSPNSAGWNNTDVTVNWNATDASGTATQPSPSLVSTEGAGQQITSSPSCDASNNCAQGTVTLNIDKTAPIVSGIQLSSSRINHTQTSTITCSGISDSLSGVARAEYYYDTDPGAGNGYGMNLSGTSATATSISGLSRGAHNLYCRSQDKAGNWSAVSNSATLTVTN